MKRISLPIVGIVAFSLCSVWSLYQLFTSKAAHPTPLLWLPAVLVELVTAWAVYQVTEHVRTLTRSNLSKQDRRFYSIVAGVFLLVALPTLGASVWANYLEFGNLLLGLLFPVASIGCAVGASIPQAVSRFEQARANERQEAQAERKQRAKERKERERQAQAARKQRQDFDKLVSNLGNAGATLAQYAANPTQSQSSVAQTLGITRQAVSQHLVKLEQEGIIKRNGNGVEIVRGAR